MRNSDRVTPLTVEVNSAIVRSVADSGAALSSLTLTAVLVRVLPLPSVAAGYTDVTLSSVAVNVVVPPPASRRIGTLTAWTPDA
jgi:hypothetical protein